MKMDIYRFITWSTTSSLATICLRRWWVVSCMLGTASAMAIQSLYQENDESLYQEIEVVTKSGPKWYNMKGLGYVIFDISSIVILQVHLAYMFHSLMVASIHLRRWWVASRMLGATSAMAIQSLSREWWVSISRNWCCHKKWTKIT